MSKRHRRLSLIDEARPSFSIDFIRQQSAPGLTFNRNSEKIFWGADGLLTTVGNHVIPYSFDPIGVDPSITAEPEHQARGVLIEEQIRNLALHSSAFSNAVWVQTGSPVISQSATLAPDGVTQSPYIESLSAVASEGIDQTVSVADDSNQRTFLMFVKSRTLSTLRARMGFTGGTPVEGYADIDLSAGTIVRQGGVDGELLQKLTKDGWHRFAIKATNNSSGNTSLYFGVRPGLVDSDVGSVHIWQADCWDDSGNTTTIATGATSQVRQPDQLTIPVGSWWPATAGTIICTGIMGRNKDGVGAFQIDDGTNNNRINLTVAGSLNCQIANGGVQVGIAAGDNNSYSPFRIAITYQTGGQIDFVQNGVHKGSNSGATVPSGLTTLRIGMSHNNSNWLNGHVASWEVYPQVLPVSKMIEKTR